jgi:hypothetical protein
MSITISTGAVFAIASTYGTVSAMSAITNATEAVATLAAGHGVVVGDYLEITSGWGRLNGQLVRAKTVVTNDVTLETINTVSTTNYPAGTGTGSVRRITAWTNLSQIKDSSVGGGAMAYADVTALDDVVARQVPTIRAPVSLSLTVFDDPALGWYSAVTTASDGAVATGLRITFPNNSKLVANAYWSLQKTPDIVKNEALTSKLDLTYAAAPVRYAT